MSERDLDAARRHLQAAAACAQSPAEGTRVARLQTMLSYLDEFWNGIRQGAATLQGAQELVLGDTRVAVIESSREELIIQAAGTAELDAAAGGPDATPGALEAKVSDLEQRANSARSPAQHRETAAGALKLLERAVKARRLEEARRLAELALSAARKSKNRSLMRQAAAAGRQVKAWASSRRR